MKRKPLPVAILIAFVLMLPIAALTGPASGQDESIPDPFSDSPISPRAAIVEEAPVEESAAETVAAEEAATAETEEEQESDKPEEKPPTALQKIDSVFKNIVGLMEQVLFYRVFTSEQEYFQFEATSRAESRMNGKWVWESDGEYFYKEKLPKLLKMTKDEAEARAEQGDLINLDPAATTPVYFSVEHGGGAPIVVLWLAGGSLFFTFYMGFFNFWGFGHAIDVVRGKYDDPNEAGEVTHMQALSSALSATVGLGNIAGVTLAMTMGGPGAFFWMICCGFFGMSSKFAECTLGQKYRHVKPDGTVLGGPMRYLDVGLSELGFRPLGIILSITFTIMCILASFGGGNMFQANQSGTVMLEQLQETDKKELVRLNEALETANAAGNTQAVSDLSISIQTLQERIHNFDVNFRIVYGLILATFVALVIIGGIKRIGAAAEKIVPTMCGIYILACLYIIAMHIGQIPSLIALIFSEAFSPHAIGGGFIGVLVVGVQRAAFSNEAGVGSAAIAHSAAKTEEPIREGAVALLEPFIDTIVICSMTALVILITGAWNNEQWVINEKLAGAALTSRAFQSEVWFFPWVLSVAVILFAYSTIISWSYYGERSWEQLFGPRSTFIYKILTICFVFLGAVFNLGAVLDFSDMMILSMAFPNILGALILAPKIKRDLTDYWRRYKAGEFKKVN